MLFSPFLFRVLGGLLSAHLLIEDSFQPFGRNQSDLLPEDYFGDLLTLAHDLGDRLLAAFGEGSHLGIPHPRVNLMGGVPKAGSKETCLAGAGSLILEFGMLSRLLGDPTYESFARRAVDALWRQRNNETGLFGNVINIETGQWVSQ